MKIKNNQLNGGVHGKVRGSKLQEQHPKGNRSSLSTPDLLYALNRLKPHVVKICEMHEATLVNVANPSDDDLNEKLKNIIVTGYSKGGNDESAGVSIQAQNS